MNRARIWRLETTHEQVVVVLVAGERTLASLDEASQSLPGGAYTTLRTYKHDCALRIADHLSRLRESAAIQGRKVSVDDLVIRQGLRQIIQGFPAGQDLRLRISIDLEEKIGDVYLVAERLKTLPANSYQFGVPVVTCNLYRDSPGAKLTRFIPKASQYRQSLPVGVEEAIMVNGTGYLLEGLSSNFFAVRDGKLWTAHQEILAGITRSTVLDVANTLGVEVELAPVHQGDIGLLQEAFISSVSRGILPVRKINDILLPEISAQGVTRKLMAAFDQRLIQEIEPI